MSFVDGVLKSLFTIFGLTLLSSSLLLLLFQPLPLSPFLVDSRLDGSADFAVLATRQFCCWCDERKMTSQD